VKRSITKAKASTEQASSGQIGQPAATMMENKKSSGPWIANARRLSPSAAQETVAVAVSGDAQILWITL
jgi:hypothetical protein